MNEQTAIQDEVTQPKPRKRTTKKTAKPVVYQLQNIDREGLNRQKRLIQKAVNERNTKKVLRIVDSLVNHEWRMYIMESMGFAVDRKNDMVEYKNQLKADFYKLVWEQPLAILRIMYGTNLDDWAINPEIFDLEKRYNAERQSATETQQ